MQGHCQWLLKWLKRQSSEVSTWRQQAQEYQHEDIIDHGVALSKVMLNSAVNSTVEASVREHVKSVSGCAVQTSEMNQK